MHNSMGGNVKGVLTLEKMKVLNYSLSKSDMLYLQYDAVIKGSESRVGMDLNPSNVVWASSDTYRLAPLLLDVRQRDTSIVPIPSR